MGEGVNAIADYWKPSKGSSLALIGPRADNVVALRKFRVCAARTDRNSASNIVAG